MTKKTLLIFINVFLISFGSFAQKFAYVDTDYILNNIPEFNQAQDKLDEISKKWQSDKIFKPKLHKKEVKYLYEGWLKAVKKTTTKKNSK